MWISHVLQWNFPQSNSFAFLCLTTPCRCSCSFPGLEATPGVSHQSVIATAVIQILLSVVLTTALIVRFLLWCRGERRQGPTIICSPVVSLNLLCSYHEATVLGLCCAEVYKHVHNCGDSCSDMISQAMGGICVPLYILSVYVNTLNSMC